jgi:hypothetical protein
MDGTELVAGVRDRTATHLDRLGSEKALVAATDATLDRDRVLEAAYAAELRAATTFDVWAADEPHGAARDAFERVAELERDHAARVGGLLSGSDPDGMGRGTDALHDYLRDLDSTVERTAAGLVARPLVSSRSLLQVINFFVNEADETAADLFRDLRADTEDLVDVGADVLDDCCADEDWDRAEAAAVGAVEAAYDEYADTLRGMGVDPEPVC